MIIQELITLILRMFKEKLLQNNNVLSGIARDDIFARQKQVIMSQADK